MGQRNLALTAAHVLRSARPPIAALLVDDEGWRAFAVRAVEDHPEEDVSIFSVEPPAASGSWQSLVRWGAGRVASSLPYHLWGYPEDAAYELVEADRVAPRPDLVYNEGYISRTLTNVPFPAVRGTRFLELSQVAGAGCSGSPVISRRPGQHWDLVGIYVGERTNDRATSAGYATRADALSDWAPELAGRPLRQEASDQ